jgi:hypothetical protein
MQSLVEAVDTGLWGFGERSRINRKSSGKEIVNEEVIS